MASSISQADGFLKVKFSGILSWVEGLTAVLIGINRVPQAVAAVQTQVRRRVLRWFVRRGWLAEEDRQEMQRWSHNGGFSLDAVEGPRRRLS